MSDSILFSIEDDPPGDLVPPTPLPLSPPGPDIEEDMDEESNKKTPAVSVVFNSFEQVLQVTGAFGTYQIMFAIVLQFTVVVFNGHFVFMTYATYTPDVYCTIDGIHNSTVIQLNHSDSHAFCKIFEGGNCSHVRYEAPFKTVIEEWHLICSKDRIPQNINSFQMLGTFFALLASILSDRIGRKTVFYASFVFLLLFGFGAVLAPGPISFGIIRCIVGALLSTSAIVNFVWSMELTDQKHNVLMNLASLWHFGYMFTALIGYLTADWRTYLIVLNCIGAPLLLVYACVFNESPRWLIQRGELTRAAKLLSTIASYNRKMHNLIISEQNLAGLPQAAPGGRTEPVRFDATLFGRPVKATTTTILFLKRRLRARALAMIVVFWATASAGTCFIFQVTQLSGSPFMKFFWYGVLRIWIPFAMYLADKHIQGYGRKQMLSIPIVAVFFCYAFAAVAITLDHHQLVYYFTLAGAVVCNMLWVGIGQYSIELFPTVIRNSACSVISLADPLASSIMPQLIYLETYFPPLPFLFVMFFAVCAFLCILFVLPETKGSKLPDTIEDVEGEPDRDTFSTLNEVDSPESSPLLEEGEEE